MNHIYEIFGTDPHSMTMRLMEAADIRGRIPDGASVALKPNLVLAALPEDGATTHTGVLSGCIEYLQGAGIRDISVIEGSWVGDETGHAFTHCGYNEVCKEYNVPFYDLKEDETRTVETPLRPMAVSCRALDAGYLINLPVLKGHCQTRMTCALKNLKGCLPDREKRKFHTEGLMRPIAALAAALRPDLTIVDSICGDLNFEEGGTPVQTNRMFLGTDPVAIDTYGCQLMGLDIADVPYIGLAETWGVGSTEIGTVTALNEPGEGTEYRKADRRISRLTKAVRDDSACSACYAALVRALYLTGDVDRPVYIGQAWKGRKLDGIGIGNCCLGAETCVKGCPPTASAIVKALT